LFIGGERRVEVVIVDEIKLSEQGLFFARLLPQFENNMSCPKSVLSLTFARRFCRNAFVVQNLNHRAKGLADQGTISCPAVVLVRTALDKNVGSVARAMLNFGLSDLRLVQPEVRELIPPPPLSRSSPPPPLLSFYDGSPTQSRCVRACG
jgi:hypothetical protein